MYNVSRTDEAVLREDENRPVRMSNDPTLETRESMVGLSGSESILSPLNVTEGTPIFTTLPPYAAFSPP
jgi:hypothetical protein